MVPEHVLAAMHPANHKTIFLLDHTPYFGGSCESVIEFDFTKSRSPGLIPLAPISKSLWTCSVEAAIEYCRIVWDLFPTGKLIRFIVSDNKAESLNSWSPSQQNLTHLLNTLASVGVPPPASEDSEQHSIFHGLKMAVQAMCECSEQQHEKRTSLDENVIPVVNRVRIICITSVADNESISIIEERLRQEIMESNKVATSSDLLIPIDHCEFVIINIQPEPMNNIPMHSVSSSIVSETHHVKASGGIANKLASLILKHYDLASTTVTGIPMKEEQNASSSANYDVEIFHVAKAHDTLFKGCGVDLKQIRTLKEGMEYSTVTLRWSTPRGCTASEMHNCTSTHRITPVDVNSRPSSCLINFLVGGRSVMLEVVRAGGSKALSHLLAAHAGQIYMHTLAFGRTLHDDPPSISEGIGGRVTDYRITDFGVFMQQNKLLPMKPGKGVGTTLKRTRSRLERHTKFWPMTISSTVIFNYRPHLEPILTLMLQPELREADVAQCKQCIYSLIGNEAKHEPLHIAPSGQRAKGSKTEEQYKQLWSELEAFLRAHCVTDKHINILNCLLEVRNKDKAVEGTEKIDMDLALKELDHISKSLERASVIRATTDSPMSPDAVVPNVHSKSILELWITKFCRQKPRPDFAGLATAQPIGNGRLRAKLYAHMKERTKSGNKGPRPPILE
ncbi:integrator complex subunit 13 isoform X2 [Cimex lectularius]|uniref:Protein asunder n=1 Tax=Cimex lectularius TaxID=79782 RepID=A0A8I6RFI2_CIMLE|nr:integrator complex subunit 13 isoform X2 [Cimex lectularius]